MLASQTALALPSLETVGPRTDLFIIDNPALTTLDFPKLQSVQSWVIESSPGLRTLDMPGIAGPEEPAESAESTESEQESEEESESVSAAVDTAFG